MFHPLIQNWSGTDLNPFVVHTPFYSVTQQAALGETPQYPRECCGASLDLSYRWGKGSLVLRLCALFICSDKSWSSHTTVIGVNLMEKIAVSEGCCSCSPGILVGKGLAVDREAGQIASRGQNLGPTHTATSPHSLSLFWFPSDLSSLSPSLKST